MVPAAIPLFVNATARVLSLNGIHLAYIACHEGNVIPSPYPIKILINTNHHIPK
jgi:hypothetical protein